jgi:putative transposase
MKKKRFTEEQIIGILKEGEAGVSTADLCRKHGMSSASFYAWRSRYGGMEIPAFQRIRPVILPLDMPVLGRIIRKAL